MKQLFFYILFGLLLTSCTALRQAVRPSEKITSSATASAEPEFVEGIEIRPDGSPAETNAKSNGKTSAQNFSIKNTAAFSSPLENYSLSQFKYAIKLDVPVELLQNRSLYDFIEKWWGTRYRMGGTTSKGIDCSAFAQTLLLSVFSFQLPRTTREQYKIVQHISEPLLKEGDLVFFSTVRRGVSHVGVYLHNNKFVHASTSSGVMISDLNDSYWGKRYIGAGRVITTALLKP